LRSSSKHNAHSGARKLAVWHVLRNVSIDLEKTIFHLFSQSTIWICHFSTVFFHFSLLNVGERFSIFHFDLRWQRNFYVAAYFSAKLSMAITYAKNVKCWQTLNIGSQNICILIYLSWIMRMKSNPSGKRKFSNTIFTFFLYLFFIFCLRLRYYWTRSSAGILRFWHRLFQYYVIGFNKLSIWFSTRARRRTLDEIILVNSYQSFSILILIYSIRFIFHNIWILKLIYFPSILCWLDTKLPGSAEPRWRLLKLYLRIYASFTWLVFGGAIYLSLCHLLSAFCSSVHRVFSCLIC
jgi:hypothetical protein